MKHQNDIPYYEARKSIVGSKTMTYSQAVLRNKYNKFKMIVKTLIQLEPGNWESFINKIKALLDTTRAADASNTSVDLAENKEELSAQTQSRLDKNRCWGENSNNSNHTADKTPCNKTSY